jgi:hypothetical protein
LPIIGQFIDEDQPIDLPEPYSRPNPAAQYDYDHLLTQDNVFGRESSPCFQSGTRDEHQLDQKLDHLAFDYHSPIVSSPGIMFSVPTPKL